MPVERLQSGLQQQRLGRLLDVRAQLILSDLDFLQSPPQRRRWRPEQKAEIGKLYPHETADHRIVGKPDKFICLHVQISLGSLRVGRAPLMPERRPGTRLVYTLESPFAR